MSINATAIFQGFYSTRTGSTCVAQPSTSTGVMMNVNSKRSHPLKRGKADSSLATRPTATTRYSRSSTQQAHLLFSIYSCCSRSTADQRPRMCLHHVVLSLPVWFMEQPYDPTVSLQPTRHLGRRTRRKDSKASVHIIALRAARLEACFSLQSQHHHKDDLE
jgi:hypothetical protein